MKETLIKKIVRRKMQTANRGACFYPHGNCMRG